MTTEQLIQQLILLATRCGSQQALAQRLNVSPAYLSDVINGKREPGEKILKPLGLTRVVSYERA